MRKDQHVVPANNDGWNVIGAGNQKASHHTDTKAEAIDIARQIAQNQHSELVIHNKNGQISGKDSHGNDSFPPKG